MTAKKKNNMRHLYCLLILIGLLSCDDILKEEPKALASETFYNTDEEVETALNAMYLPLRESNCLGGLYPAQQEAYADYGFGRGSYTLVSKFQGLDDSNIGRAGSMWDLFYRSIRNANIIIERVPLGKDLTDENKAQALAEARFIRSLSYLLLMQNWGDIPLRTELNMNQQDLPKSSVETIWEHINEDLKFASENLPNTPRMWGTPSLWSAKTVFLQSLLYQKKYQEAKKLADEIIQSGVYKLVDVDETDDFQKIYGADLISSSEEIFYIKYSRQGNKGWQFPMFPHNPAAGYLGGLGYFALISDSENKAIKEWDNKDLRKEYNWYSWDIGLGSTTILNRKYRDYQATGGGTIGVDYPLYRYPEVLLWAAELDCRVNGNPTSAGLNALNMVHRRAYGYKHDQVSPVDFKLSDFTSADVFIRVVAQERSYETCYEGKRWLDMKRLGIAKEVIKDVYNIDIAEKHMLWPIPLSEMNYNKALVPEKDQNPGY